MRVTLRVYRPSSASYSGACDVNSILQCSARVPAVINILQTELYSVNRLESERLIGMSLDHTHASFKQAGMENNGILECN
jgi:hypothetical protein